MSRFGESTTTGRERNIHIYFLLPRAFFRLFLSSFLARALSRSFPLFLRSSSSSRRSSSLYFRSGILKPPCRNKTGLWSTRASARLVAFQKYNVSTVCLTHRIYISTYRVYDAQDVLTKYFFYDFRDQTSRSANGEWKCTV